MKKSFIILSFIFCVTNAHAQGMNIDDALNQEVTYDNLGEFSNINTVIDKTTNQERELTDAEIKKIVIEEVTRKLKLSKSTRRVDTKRVSVLGDIVSVPIVEQNGYPFYVMNINKKSGLSGGDLKINEGKQKRKQSIAEWEKAFIEQESRMDSTKKAVLDYRKQNPADPTMNKFMPKVPDEVYKPKRIVRPK